MSLFGKLAGGETNICEEIAVISWLWVENALILFA